MPPARRSAEPPIQADERLRAHVRLLGTLLGETLIGQEGKRLYDLEEAVRSKTTLLRERHDDGVRRALDRQLRGVDIATAGLLIRAFTLYFQLVNLAELEHRVQLVRDIAASPDAVAGSGTFADLFARAAGTDGGRARLAAALPDLDIVPVLTAHPTQVARRSVLDNVTVIARAIDDLDDPRLTPARRQAIERRMRAHITLLWQTEELRSTQLRVRDEARNARFVLEDILFDVVPEVMAELRNHPAPEAGSAAAMRR